MNAPNHKLGTDYAEAKSHVEDYYSKNIKAWDFEAKDLRRSRNIAFLIAAVCGIAALFSNFGWVYAAGLPKQEPFFIQVDNVSGEAKSLGNISQHGASFTPSKMSIQSFLQKFVTQAFSLPLDKKVWNSNIDDVFFCVTTKGNPILTNYIKAREPVKDLERNRIEVTIESVLNSRENIWRVDWTETKTGLDGTKVFQKQFRGDFVLYIEPPKTQQIADHNPLGIYVDSFDIQELIKS